ncbi:MAG: 3-phosphoshikimate 1-carboxyvinyltransferase [Candidatus Lambdaproteobacteria bacterium RIFOXYD1_FULL_56_27]|uniref:3-phosphoshikimate 1-carboxyvinyltransferase n=1 Tax=Candidatus Lambdaproteobacteria bacterium RIFOXYD2_FULL_56_26 TaxID=1817773 RepID=A0A1F6H331_9PROT|nr:MAG: 3-phosphoshikimate 1-carboxyvinyltransferase [Candidatus Lambdaproteobacteria bacterium RIFOXYD2_FULL_56_26]OGH05326.1 MAG: 3-phosphoshikimate 1-carboxyvinyltransferase [Candidatus Lambdaproteobacteria bacterium RIFOXYC1_FULL_56_13]OGH09168.1 MAG: 3-phosphoshikimate 1-carboxyvinyltransferase [Candidatus Lambdaproteobacteria bacterium RIFOXYD1_FULL_56_27]
MSLPETLQIPCSLPVHADLSIPGSKSLTNRALLVAALAQGTSQLKGMLHSDDTHYMTEALKALGVTAEPSGTEMKVVGSGGRFSPYAGEIYVENAGTAARFLTAALGLGQGTYRLNGNARMRQRPILDLVQALGSLGVKVTDLEGTGCPPLLIEGGGFKGGAVEVRGDQSSQYLSALMLTAPCAPKDTVITIEGPLVSRTYVEMTRKIMADFGAQSHWLDPTRLSVKGGQGYRGREYQIEADASSASYFFGLAAIAGGRIRVHGIEENSTQGDLGLVRILEAMGCQVTFESGAVVLERDPNQPLQSVEVDMNSMSDVAPTLAVVALFAQGRTRIGNVANMRIKECDRIKAVVTELGKLGAKVEEFEDGLAVTGGAPLKGAKLHSYDDHRMAMCLSLAGVKLPGVVIENPSCVSKTFPDFYQRFWPLLVPATEQDRALLGQLGG